MDTIDNVFKIDILTLCPYYLRSIYYYRELESISNVNIREKN